MVKKVLYCSYHWFKECYITIIQVYAPTFALPEEERENFYNISQTEIDKTDKCDQILVMGDFNSKAGRIVDSNEKGVVGNFGLG